MSYLPPSPGNGWPRKRMKEHEPSATHYGYSAVLQVLVTAWLFRICTRLHISCSKCIDFRAQNAKRRRASKVFPGSGHAPAHGTFAFTTSHYAGGFPASVWMRISCQRSPETARSRRRSRPRHYHCPPGKVPQRSLGSTRLASREPLAKVCCPVSQSPAQCHLLPGTQWRPIQLTHGLHTFS